jgi:hypothetical protein
MPRMLDGDRTSSDCGAGSGWEGGGEEGGSCVRAHVACNRHGLMTVNEEGEMNGTFGAFIHTNSLYVRRRRKAEREASGRAGGVSKRHTYVETYYVTRAS